jgi:hypothetical protein
MQSTLFFTLIFPPPPARSEVFSRSNRSCTRLAPDAWKSFIMQWVVGDIVLFQKMLYLRQCPMKQGMDFDDLIALIPLDEIHIFPIWRLLRSNPGNPYIVTLNRTF